MAAFRNVGLLLVLLLAAAAALSASAATLAAGDHLQLGFFSSSSSGGVGECRGTVGECGGGAEGEDGEGELGSPDADAHRRLLYGRAYISYGALRRGSVPCSRRGASYYNCRAGGQANPYHRGCSRITRCRG